MDKFSDFISEQKNEQPYRVLNLIHDTPDDPNKTGDMIEKEAKKMGIDCYQLKIDNGYFCLLYTSPSPRDKRQSRMPSSA